MAKTLASLAELVGGELHGPANELIHRARIIRDAEVGDITLADHPKLATPLSASKASAVLVPANFSPNHIPYITVANVHEAFAKVVGTLQAPFRPERTGIHPTARIHPTATISPDAEIGADVSIGAHVVVEAHVRVGARASLKAGVFLGESSQIGEDTVVFPNVVIYEHSVIGPRSLIHANSVIGAYGFGYERKPEGFVRVAQLGNVEIGADVEIGACSTIDRGTYGPTMIGAGTKIDNQVMIAHNCRIGRNNILCSHVGIAGSVSTGDDVIMAGQVGVKDHLHIGRGAVIGAQAGLMSDVPEGASYLGSPAIPTREQMLVFAASHKLPEMRKSLKDMERAVKRIEEQLGAPPAQEDSSRPWRKAS